jgi:hypothetical protein
MIAVWLFTGLALIANGLILKHYPPKKLTWWCNGIKLPFATRSTDTWKEANRYLATLQVYFGVLVLLILCLFHYFLQVELTSNLFTTLVISGSAGMIGLTRTHINNYFDRNGNWK